MRQRLKKELFSLPSLNLLRLLEKNLEKPRLELTHKCYLAMSKHEDTFSRAVHSDKFYRLYVLENNGTASNKALVDFKG